MILFVDTDRVGESVAANSRAGPQRLASVVHGLGRCADLVEVVATSNAFAESPLEGGNAAHAEGARKVVTGHLWDEVPPLPLGRYEHIIYWLTRRHVLRLPTWLAAQPSQVDWPPTRVAQRFASDAFDDAHALGHALRGQVERYYGADLWWGNGPLPDADLRRQAHGLMVAWGLPRRRWQRVLGATVGEFEARMDRLLTIHAGAQPRVRAGLWPPHWVQLPHAGLETRRPVELMEAGGLAGIEQVLAYVWRADPVPE